MSLFAKCLDILATPNGIKLNKYNLETIPVHIKTALLKVLCKRGLINDSFVFKNLINSNLTAIDLSECEVSNDLLCCLSKCQRLQKLDLSLGRKQIRVISSKILISLFEQLKSLKVIIIPHCPEINDEVIEKICHNCMNLTELHIPNSSITDKSLYLIGNNMSTLRVINISGTQVSDLGISYLVSGKLSQTLEEINVDKCYITPHSSVLIAEKLSNIKIFNCGSFGESEVFNLALSKINAKAKQVFWTL